VGERRGLRSRRSTRRGVGEWGGRGTRGEAVDDRGLTGHGLAQQQAALNMHVGLPAVRALDRLASGTGTCSNSSSSAPRARPHTRRGATGDSEWTVATTGPSPLGTPALLVWRFGCQLDGPCQVHAGCQATASVL
jgi:hypothetical protein